MGYTAESHLHGTQPETLIYKKVDEVELRLLVMKPEGWSAGDGRSAVLWIHGGGWTGGGPEQFLPHCRYMASRGAVAFSVQYRLLGPGRAGSASRTAAGAVSLADCLADCEDAVRYIRECAAQLGVDPSRIIAAGDSAGGHLAACLGTIAVDSNGIGVSSRADAVINCNGIVDLTGKWRDVMERFLIDEETDEEEAIRTWFKRREDAIKLSPLFRVQADQPPTLTLHGLLDRTVEAEQAIRYYEAHTACGNQSKLVLFPGSKHAFILFNYTASQEETLRALGEIDDFLTSLGLLKGDSQCLDRLNI